MVAMVILVTFWILTRDLFTRSYVMKKAKDHIWVEFAPKVGNGFSQLVKLDDKKTGEFSYQERKYFAGGETWLAPYPPGRGSLAQVPFIKCLADPASSDMLTNITGKPTVNSALVFAMAEQKDTQQAMDRSREMSGGSNTIAKNWIWLWIGLGAVGLIVVANLVFAVKGIGINESILSALQKLTAAFPGVQ